MSDVIMRFFFIAEPPSAEILGKIPFFEQALCLYVDVEPEGIAESPNLHRSVRVASRTELSQIDTALIERNCSIVILERRDCALSNYGNAFFTKMTELSRENSAGEGAFRPIVVFTTPLRLPLLIWKVLQMLHISQGNIHKDVHQYLQPGTPPSTTVMINITGQYSAKLG